MGDGEAGRGFSRILPSRQHVPVMVAGARNAAISMVVRVFGLWSGASVPVETRHDPAAAAAAAGPPAPPGAGDSGHPASDRPADAGPGGYPSGPGPGPAEAEAG
jgi:hypothetical protein